MLNAAKTGSARTSAGVRAEVGARMDGPGTQGGIRPKGRRSGLFWPFGVAVSGVAGGLLVALRGCWHRRMSWPVGTQGHSYQVCLGCGVKRLFDEDRFRSYGPFRYDLDELLAWARKHTTEPESDRLSNGPVS
jgi:hypothetical protein